MRILVTGARGMLAQALVPELESRAHEVVALARAALDVTDCDAVRDCLLEIRPEVVVQCAAYTAVDAAEADEESGHRVNADATQYIAEACQEIGARLVYPSTDYVFSGVADRPYRPEDPTSPINAYGRSKLAGEMAARRSDAALIVRTSWLYGAGGGNFVETILRLAREREQIDVVADQFGRPTWTVSLAQTLIGLIEHGASGIFHASDGGEPVSWHGFAAEIIAQEALPLRLTAVPSTAFPRPAPRPAYSVLDCTRVETVLGRHLPDWRESLRAYLGSRRGHTDE